MKSSESVTENTSKAIANQSFGKDCISLQSPYSSVTIQPKLTINQPNDVYEQEADSVADAVMRMTTLDIQTKPLSIAGIQRKCAHCEEEEKNMQRKEFNNAPATANNELESYVGNLNSGGQSLSDETRSFYEPRFGYDFSNVKVHTDSVAAKSAQSINALAYTNGNSIVFNEGQYSPNTDSGKRLLGHELTHVVQQAESPGLAMRRQLQKSGLIIQRSVTTWGGTWDTDNYADAIDKDAEGNPTPVADGVRGVDITLKFTPGSNANAELIGLTQIVNTIVGGTPTYLSKTTEDRSIKAGDAIVTNPASGATDEGFHVDQSATNRNPLYAVEGAPGGDTNLYDTGANAGWGQHGWNYSGGTPPIKEATLKDGPRMAHADKNSSQTFESTAIAIKGVQAGTYYGSVQWGWQTNSAGAYTKIALAPVSQGTPSSTFMKAAEIWNASKTSTGAETLDLPIVNVKVTTRPVTDISPSFLPMSIPPLVLPANTRVDVIFGGASTTTGDRPPQIRVVDGVFTGRVLSISLADLLSLRDERP